MTRAETITFAIDAGFNPMNSEEMDMFVAFAKLVVEKEREACAKLIAKLTEMLEIQQKLHETAIDMLKPAIEAEREACAKIADEWAVGWPHTSQVIAERIRARGQA